MFTETDLRDALDHSAARADALADRHSVLVAAPDSSRQLGRRIVLPIAVAATAAAVIAGGTLVGHRSTARPAATKQSSISAATTTAPAPAPKRVPATVSVVDRFTIGAANPTYEILDASTPATNAEYGGAIVDGQDIEVVAIPESAGFNPETRFTGAQRVPVAGVLGYYGSIVLWPADGVPDQNTDKHGGPGPALGWRTADGTWLFVTTGPGGPKGAASLAAAYRKLHVTLHGNTTRLPYQTGYLPAGMHLDSLGSAGSNPVSDATLVAGHRRIDINVSRGDLAVKSPGTKSVFRTVGGYSVAILGSGYSRATLQRVLDSMKFADPSSGGAGWWTLARAFG